MNKVAISAAIIVFLAVIYWFYSSDAPITLPAESVLDNFAKCLADTKAAIFRNFKNKKYRQFILPAF